MFRMGEGIAGLPPISCHTMIKRSVERHAASTAIVDRHRHRHTAQKRFIYRLLTRHDFLPVWLVADK